MKKKAILTGILIIGAFFAIIYLFIPSVVRVSATQTLALPVQAATRTFSDGVKLKSWWPDSIPGNGKISFKNFTFRFAKFDISNMLGVTIFKDNQYEDSLSSVLNFLVLGNDSSIINWKCEFKTSLSPIVRVRQFLKFRELKKTMSSILSSFSQYGSNVTNIYGFNIQREKVPDSIVVSEKHEYTYYPGTSEIYASIHSLEEYLRQQNATQSNLPMYNITPDGNKYKLMTAIPINKEIKESAAQKIKNLLYHGNILTAEITGGNYCLDNAFKSLTNYIRDYELTPVAISYQVLLTDRQKNTDTSQWKTKICFPIY